MPFHCRCAVVYHQARFRPVQRQPLSAVQEGPAPARTEATVYFRYNIDNIMASSGCRPQTNEYGRCPLWAGRFFHPDSVWLCSGPDAFLVRCPTAVTLVLGRHCWNHLQNALRCQSKTIKGNRRFMQPSATVYTHTYVRTYVRRVYYCRFVLSSRHIYCADARARYRGGGCAGANAYETISVAP